MPAHCSRAAVMSKQMPLVLLTIMVSSAVSSGTSSSVAIQIPERLSPAAKPEPVSMIEATCKETTGIRCRLVPTCPAQTGAECVSGKCLCKPGFCFEDGICKEHYEPPPMTPAPFQPPPDTVTVPPTSVQYSVSGKRCLPSWQGNFNGAIYHCASPCCMMVDPMTSTLQPFCGVQFAPGMYTLEECAPGPAYNPYYMSKMEEDFKVPLFVVVAVASVALVLPIAYLTFRDLILKKGRWQAQYNEPLLES